MDFELIRVRRLKCIVRNFGAIFSIFTTRIYFDEKSSFQTGESGEKGNEISKLQKILF